MPLAGALLKVLRQSRDVLAFQARAEANQGASPSVVRSGQGEVIPLVSEHVLSSPVKWSVHARRSPVITTWGLAARVSFCDFLPGVRATQRSTSPADPVGRRPAWRLVGAGDMHSLGGVRSPIQFFALDQESRANRMHIYCSRALLASDRQTPVREVMELRALLVLSLG